MKKQYTSDDIRAALQKRLHGQIQARIARQIGVSPQNLSVMASGGPIHGKVLAWLGYRRVEGIYEKVAL